MKALTTKRIVSLVICVLLFVLFLCGWVKVSVSEMLGVESDSASVFGLAGVMGDMSDLVDQMKMWIGSSELDAAAVLMKIVTVLFYLMVIALIGSVALNIWDTLFKSGRKGLGYIVVLAVTTVIILIVIIINASLKDEIGFGSLLKLTATPFLTLLVAAGGLYVVKKVPEGNRVSNNVDIKNLGNSIKNVAQRVEDGKRFQIYYYSPRSMIRPISAQIVNSSGAFRFEFVSYSSGPVTAIRASIELVTAFRDIIKIDSVPFTNLTRSDEKYATKYRTEFVEIKVDPDLLRQIHEIRVYPTDVVINGELAKCDSSTEIVKTSIPIDRLDALRSAQGADVMENVSIENDKWRCYCGTSNAVGQRCRLCGRYVAVPTYSENRDNNARVSAATNFNSYEQPQNRTKRCPSCGEQLDYQTKFCYRCGARLQ